MHVRVFVHVCFRVCLSMCLCGGGHAHSVFCVCVLCVCVFMRIVYHVHGGTHSVKCACGGEEHPSQGQGQGHACHVGASGVSGLAVFVEGSVV